MAGDELVRIYEVNNPFQAEIIRNGLETAGIACEIEGVHQAGLSAILAIGLYVKAADADQARQIIREHEGGKEE